MQLLKIGVAVKVLRTLAAVICNFLYRIIAGTYQLFMTISSLNILSSEDIAPIYQRVTMILTIIMTFYITFEFVKYTINPENITDKEKGVGNILQRIVISVMLIAFVPTIFRLAYGLQSRIINNQLITKIILGRSTANYESYGNQFSSVMLSQFYELDTSNCSNLNRGECKAASDAVTNNLKELSQKGTVDIASDINLYAEEGSGLIPLLRDIEPAIKFDGIFALVVGGFIVYILLMYSIDLGTRYVQLIFLQIISPIAIMGYLLPKKDGIFQKWMKQCITTYFDLFIRIAIIDFVILIVKLLGDAFDHSTTLFNSSIGTPSPAIKTFTYIALVMGLLLFAQRAPKLLGELLPGGGAASIGFGLGSKSRLEPVTKLAKNTKKAVSNTANTAGRVATGTGAAIAGFSRGAGVRERLRLAGEGAKAGYDKNNKGSISKRFSHAQAAIEKRQMQEAELLRNAPIDGSLTGAAKINAQEQAIREATIHSEQWANVAQDQDRKAKLFETASTGMDSINKSIDEFKQIKALKQELESAKSRGASAAEVKTLDAKYKTAVQTVRKAIASVTDDNGNVDMAKFNQLVQNGVKFKYSEMDANGFAIEYEPVYETDAVTGKVIIDATTGKPKIKIDPNTGRAMMKKKDKIEVDFKFDSGDANFAGSVARAENNEFLKMQAAAKDLSTDAVTANLFNNAKVEINGVTKNINEWLAEPNGREIYAEYVNKFKDALVDPKNAYENTEEYQRAHAFKDGVGSNGGKK